VATDRWIKKAVDTLPAVDYAHLTFTVPLEVRQIMFDDPLVRRFLFKAASGAILSWMKDHNKSIPAALLVLHTFGRDMKFHPHIHALVSSGGLDIKTEKVWLVNNHWPRRSLERRFKAELLKLLYKEKKIGSKLQNTLWKTEWYVYAALAKVSSIITAGYIGRYTRRPPLSEARIIGYNPDNEGRVMFKYEDWYDGKQEKNMTLTADEFIGRLLQHVPPKHARLVQGYGLIHNRVKAKYRPILQKMFGQQPIKENQSKDDLTWRERQTKLTGKDPLICPECQTEMVLTEIAYWSTKENKIKIHSLP
jgi:hypothetical protein